jgi:uncharacterized phiE125 gp8 family phage protein
MSWVTIMTPPIAEALSLDAAKAFLRIGTAHEDALVLSLIAAAQEALERETGFALVTRTVRRHWHAWPESLTRGGVVLNPHPATELVGVEIIDVDGGAQLVTGRFAMHGGRLLLRPFVARPEIPDGGHAAMTYVCGFGTAQDVPADLVLALKQLVQSAYLRGDTAPRDGAIWEALQTARGVRL